MENNIEVRSIEIRANVEDRTIKGTAIVFNSDSENLGGFVERISPEAITIEFLDRNDIVMLYNHNQDSGVLARSKNGKGTLKYSVDERGVNFEFEAKNTALGNEVLEGIRNGDYSQCSFAFRVAEGGDKWENRDGMYLRTINKMEMIRDFSVVTFPAYQATSVNLRGLEQLKNDELESFKLKEDEDKRLLVEKEAEELRLIEEEKVADELRKEKELAEYYSKYNDVLNRYNIN